MLLSKSGNSPNAAIPKVISPTVHGMIDYCHAAFFFTVGLVCSRSHNKAAARAAFATSGFILVQSLLTDYRFGAKPVFSFETHGKMDAVFASSSWIAEASVVALTNWNSQRAHEERQAPEGR
jgi:uncharacterized PurR-regulated membrane protein YhhQ (DUF165 family)